MAVVWLCVMMRWLLSSAFQWIYGDFPGSDLDTKKKAILTEVFHGFRQALHLNTVVVLLFRPRSSPSIYFPVHCSLIIASFDTIEYNFSK
jgi:hypothetical protein